MTQLYPVAGSKIYIGANPLILPDNTYVVLTDFASVSWTEIGEWSQMGAMGDTATLITTPLINEARDIKQKGTRNAGQMQNVFAVSPLDAGQIALIAAEKTIFNYPFKVEVNNAPPLKSSVVTMTIAAPGVITWANHGLSAGTPVKFSTTGALPTGLTAGTTYYVSATGLTSGSFQVSATPGGASITTSGSQSGVHTLSNVPAGALRYFVGLVMSAQEAGGGANTILNLNSTIEINRNIVHVAAVG